MNETVHMCPPQSSGIMPCCGRTPFEVRAERITLDPDLVTCAPKDEIYSFDSDAAMVFLNGSKRSFRCHCGCNIFNTRPNSQYECNACGELYQGS